MFREKLSNAINNLGVNCEISSIYGKGTVLKLDLNPAYYLYTPISNIDPGFFNVTENVIQEMNRDKVDFALVFVKVNKEGNDDLYVYDKQSMDKLLKNASIEKKYGNYRITTNSLENPISLNAFIEFIDSLI